VYTDLNSRHGKTEWYEELCALDAIGELSTDEARELRQHLETCQDCRAMHADFRRLATDDLGAVAIRRDIAKITEKLGDELQDERELLQRVLQTAQRERENTTPFLPRVTENSRKIVEPDDLRERFSFLTPAIAYPAIAILFIAAGSFFALHLRNSVPPPITAQAPPHTVRIQAATEAKTEQSIGETRVLQQEFVAEKAQLDRRLGEAQAKYEAAVSEQNKAKDELTARDAQIDQLNRDLLAAKNIQEQKDKLLESFELKLEQEDLRAEEQRAQIVNLERKLQATEQESAGDNDAARKGFDSKSVLGARDLHIVDVYDVDGSGKTQRTYGRVFYIEKKFLVFYAFDLEDKKRNRTVGGFQAWGYRQPDAGKPEDLGLFTIEDAKLNRWVLTVDDSRILQRIDAVFVTAEPAGGSPSPRGRKVLYANLAGPPNHP
jgi:anti-sigma factor RsiW